MRADQQPGNPAGPILDGPQQMSQVRGGEGAFAGEQAVDRLRERVGRSGGSFRVGKRSSDNSV